MKTEPKKCGPRSWVVLDIESAVLDDIAHKRYQAMERWVPVEGKPSRRGYRRSEDPLSCPRWVFQTITTASLMLLVEDAQGGVDVTRFVTLSAPDHDERDVIAGILRVLADAPDDAEIVTWMGLAHDLPILINGCMRYGLNLPRGWGWLAHGGFHHTRHLDLARAYGTIPEYSLCKLASMAKHTTGIISVDQVGRELNEHVKRSTLCLGNERAFDVLFIKGVQV